MASGSNLRTVVQTAARKHLEILELLEASNATSNEVSESSKIVVSTIILMIWIIGMTSNVVIWIRACSPRCQGLFGQRALSVYVVHKSIADFMFLLSCPFHIAALFHPKGWLFGPVGCRFIASVDMLAILLSGNALFSLGIERYTSVVRASMSVSHRLKRLRRSYLHIAAIWVYCVILASPVIAVSTSYTGLDGRVLCGYIWPQSNQNFYQMFFSVQFFLQFFFVFGTLGYMWYHAWRFAKKNSGVQRFFSRRRDMRKHRAIVILCVTHFLCWFPFWIWHFLRTTGRPMYEVILGTPIPGGSSAPELAITTLIYIPSSISLLVFMGCIDEWRNGCHVRESSMPNRLAKRDRTTYNVEIGLQPIDERRYQDTVVTVSYHVKPDDVDGDSPGKRTEDGDDNDSGQGSSEAAPRGTDDIHIQYQNDGFRDDDDENVNNGGATRRDDHCDDRPDGDDEVNENVDEDRFDIENALEYALENAVDSARESVSENGHIGAEGLVNERLRC